MSEVVVGRRRSLGLALLAFACGFGLFGFRGLRGWRFACFIVQLFQCGQMPGDVSKGRRSFIHILGRCRCVQSFCRLGKQGRMFDERVFGRQRLGFLLPLLRRLLQFRGKGDRRLPVLFKKGGRAFVEMVLSNFDVATANHGALGAIGFRVLRCPAA